MSFIEVRNRSGVLFYVSEERLKEALRYTISYDTKKYNQVINTGKSGLANLKDVFKKAQVPYPVLFMDDKVFKKNLDEYMSNTFGGVNKGRTYSIATSGSIDISQIALLLKHISLLQKHIATNLEENKLIGFFSTKKELPTESMADIARKSINFNLEEFWAIKRKEEAFLYIENKLGVKNIFISTYDYRMCAQQVNAEDLAGIFIKHKKAPYLFVRASDDKGSVELWGRRILIIILLFWFLLNKMNKPVMMDTKHRSSINDKAYLFAEEFLMPRSEFISNTIDTYKDIEQLGDKYKTSPSAIIMRASRLGIINNIKKSEFFEERDTKFAEYRNSQGYGNSSFKIEKNIIKNIGRHATDIILNQLSNGRIDELLARKLLSPRKGASFNMSEIMEYNI